MTLIINHCCFQAVARRLVAGLPSMLFSYFVFFQEFIAFGQIGVRHRLVRMADPGTKLEYALHCLRYIPDSDDGEEVVGDIGIWRGPESLFSIDFDSCPHGNHCEAYAFYVRQKQRHNLLLAAFEEPNSPLTALAQIKSSARGPSGEFLFDGFFYDELLNNSQTINGFLEFVDAVRADPELAQCVIAVAVGGLLNDYLKDSQLMQKVQDEVDFWCPETYYRPSDSPPLVERTDIGECGIISLESMANGLAGSPWSQVLEKTIPLICVSDNFLAEACVAHDNYSRKVAANGLLFGGYQSQYIQLIAERAGPLQRLAGIGFWSDRLATRHTILETDRSFKNEFLFRIGDDTLALGAPTFFNWQGNLSAFATLSTPTPGVSRVMFAHAVQASNNLYGSLRFPLDVDLGPGLYSLQFDYRTNYDVPLETYLGSLNLNTGGWDMASYDNGTRDGDTAWHTTTMYFDPCDNTSDQTALQLSLSWHGIPILAGSYIEFRNVRFLRIRPEKTKSLFRHGQTALLDGRLDANEELFIGGSSPPRLKLRTSAFLFPSGTALAAIVKDTDALVCGPDDTPCDIDYLDQPICGIWSSIRANIIDVLPAGHYDLDFWYCATWKWCRPGSSDLRCVNGEDCQGRPWVGLFKPPWDLLAGTRSNFDLSSHDLIYAAGSDQAGRQSDGAWRKLHMDFDLTQSASGQGYGLHFAEVWGDASVLKSSSFAIDNIQLRRTGDPVGTSRVIDPWVTRTDDFGVFDSYGVLAPKIVLDLVDMSYFPESETHLVVTPGSQDPGTSYFDLPFTAPVSTGVIGVSFWACAPLERGLYLSVVDDTGSTLSAKMLHVPGDSTVWHAITCALAIPEGSRTMALRFGFSDGSGFGAAPVFLDEVSAFRVSTGRSPSVVSVGSSERTFFEQVELLGSAPNLMSMGTTIRFGIPRNVIVQIRIYDVSGHLVREVVHQPLRAGQHVVIWDGRDLYGRGVEPGTYLCRLTTPIGSASTKIVSSR